MWWHSWEMWGRGRFRKIRKSKQKDRKRRRLDDDSKIYIVADPVDLNPIFNDPRTARKYYRSLPQPGIPSPTESDRIRESQEIEEGEEDEVVEVEVSRPYRQSVLRWDSKRALGLTPLPEASQENTPSPKCWSRSSNHSLLRKTEIPPETPSDPPNETPFKPSSECPTESPSSIHSPTEQAKTNIDGPEFQKGKLEGRKVPTQTDPEAGPSHKVGPHRVPDSFPEPLQVRTSGGVQSSDHSSSSSSPYEFPAPRSDAPSRRNSDRRPRAPYSSHDNSESDQDDLSPIREDEVLPDFGILNDPFKVGWIDNFIKDEQFLEDLVTFVANGPFQKRDNDLFTYHQMDDEIFMSNPLTKRLLTSLVTSVLPFMSKVVGRELNAEKVSLSASKYCYTDHLLCHDDKTGDRRIAFIIYLNKNWERTWGGTLDLFRRDYLNDPGQITASLVPEFNRMVFFEVTSFSFHQVSEVLKDGAERISVNGWFHYPLCKEKSLNQDCASTTSIR